MSDSLFTSSCLAVRPYTFPLLRPTLTCLAVLIFYPFLSRIFTPPPYLLLCESMHAESFRGRLPTGSYERFNEAAAVRAPSVSPTSLRARCSPLDHGLLVQGHQTLFRRRSARARLGELRGVPPCCPFSSPSLAGVSAEPCGSHQRQSETLQEERARDRHTLVEFKRAAEHSARCVRRSQFTV